MNFSVHSKAVPRRCAAVPALSDFFGVDMTRLSCVSTPPPSSGGVDGFESGVKLRPRPARYIIDDATSFST